MQGEIPKSQHTKAICNAQQQRSDPIRPDLCDHCPLYTPCITRAPTGGPLSHAKLDKWRQGINEAAYVYSGLHPYNFGNILMPVGYTVLYSETTEHYYGEGPDDWESVIFVSPFDARKACLDHYHEALDRENLDNL